MKRDLFFGAIFGFLVAGLVIFLHHPRNHPKPQESDVPVTNHFALARLTAPPLPRVAAPVEPVENPQTNFFILLMNGETNLTVTTEQLRDFLEKNHRNADSLLGAYRVTRDKSLLKEAEEKFPNDPRVDFDAAFFGPPEERRKWLDTLKQSAPDNALANYLSAADYFKSGQKDQALQELLAAGGKSAFSDYSLDFTENSAEAYQAAGYSLTESEMAASTQLLLPQLAEFKSVGVNLVDLAKSYQQSGDAASAQAALQMASDLGQRLNQGNSLTLIQTLVGVAIQRMVEIEQNPTADLHDPNSPFIQQRQAISALNRQSQNLFPQMSEQDALIFMERRNLFGEQAALQWLVNKYGSQ
jgi:tetratricopeptide (TPR) repeat protein